MELINHFYFSWLKPLPTNFVPFYGALLENGIIYRPQLLLSDYSISSNWKIMKILTIDDWENHIVQLEEHSGIYYMGYIGEAYYN